MSDIRRQSCEYCDAGWVEDAPIPTPDGPHYRLRPCSACGGIGFVGVEYRPITEDDLEEPAPSRPDPRDPDLERPGIFCDHNCWKCKNGAGECVNGNPRQCEYPHARND